MIPIISLENYFLSQSCDIRNVASASGLPCSSAFSFVLGYLRRYLAYSFLYSLSLLYFDLTLPSARPDIQHISFTIVGEWVPVEVMEASSKMRNRQRTASQKCCLYSIIALVLILIILVIAIPVAVLLPKKNHVVEYTGPGVSTSVIVPLYIYPGDGSWDPLYEA